jgi:hypothetical protein
MTSRELRARTRRVRHAQQAPSCVQARDGHDKEAPQAGRLRVRQAEQGSRAMKKKQRALREADSGKSQGAAMASA